MERTDLVDEKNLKNLRQQIDTLDDKILDLLNRRADVVVAVGKAKDESAVSTMCRVVRRRSLNA